jgi:hypothetical protein
MIGRLCQFHAAEIYAALKANPRATELARRRAAYALDEAARRRHLDQDDSCEHCLQELSSILQTARAAREPFPRCPSEPAIRITRPLPVTCP